MIKIKKDGFTLSEVLITLAVVGTLAVMVIPGLIKDASNKAMVALLQSTVSNISSAIQTEVVNTRTSNLDDTDIVKNPEAFLKKYLNVKRVCTDSEPCLYTGKTQIKHFNTLGGGTISAATPNVVVLLQNGVAVAIAKNGADNGSASVYIDLNGITEPNTVGIDHWIFDVKKKTDLNADPPTHAGEMGSRDSYRDNSTTNLKSTCKSGIAPACYTLLERSGFDPDYINK